MVGQLGMEFNTLSTSAVFTKGTLSLTPLTWMMKSRDQNRKPMSPMK